MHVLSLALTDWYWHVNATNLFRLVEESGDALGLTNVGYPVLAVHVHGSLKERVKEILAYTHTHTHFFLIFSSTLTPFSSTQSLHLHHSNTSLHFHVLSSPLSLHSTPLHHRTSSSSRAGIHSLL